MVLTENKLSVPSPHFRKLTVSATPLLEMQCPLLASNGTTHMCNTYKQILVHAQERFLKSKKIKNP